MPGTFQQGQDVRLCRLLRPCIPFPRGLGRQPVFSLAACPEVFRCRFRNGHRLSLRCRNIIVVCLRSFLRVDFLCHNSRMKMGNGALPPLPGWILRMKKGVLFALLVGGMDHDLRRADDVHVHFMRIWKRTARSWPADGRFQDVRVVRVIHPIHRLESMPVENSPSTIVCSGIPTTGTMRLPLKR